MEGADKTTELCQQFHYAAVATFDSYQQSKILGAVVAQLTERPLPLLEDPGSNPDISNFFDVIILC